MKKLKDLMEVIDYKFKDFNLLKTALTHSSYEKKLKFKNYERLEFLGDRVLGLVISNEIFKVFNNSSEGEMAKRLSYLVCKKTLNEIAEIINIEDYLLYSKDIKKKSLESIKANSLEALIAAIFLDSNFSKTSKIILKLWKSHIQNTNLSLLDPKSKLQEWCLKNKKKLPVYKLLKKTGPDHRPVFDIEVLVNNSISAKANGLSKQEAEINAAKKLLKIICEQK